MVDTQTRQSSNSFSLDQILQTDGALSTVFAEHVRCTKKKEKHNVICVLKTKLSEPFLSMPYLLL